MVHCIGHPSDQAQSLRPVGEADDGVMFHEEIAGDVTDRRTVPSGVPPHSQQKLVLRSGQPESLGSLLTPALEPAEFCPERQQSCVLGI